MLPARAFVLFAALPLLASGCLTSSTVPSGLGLPALPEVPGLPIVQDHEHDDPALHTGSFAIDLIATATGYDGPIPSGVGYSEVEVKDGWAYLCRNGPGPALGPLGSTAGGFVVINVSDPRNPQNVGDLPGVACVDIKVNDAGDLVFYATQRNRPGEFVAHEGDANEKAPRGLYLVNVADKAAPFVERFVPVPFNGVHTVHYVDTGSAELVLAQTYDHLPDSGLGLPPAVGTGMQNPATQRLQIFEVVQGSDGLRDLALRSAFRLPEPPPPGQNYFPHDVTVQKHPLTGQWLGYIAYWDHGLVVIDLDDPADPQLVGRNADGSPSAYLDSHQARPFPHLIAGKHVTVLEPEIESGDEPGQFTLFDTSDPQDPQRLGYWKLPGDVVIPGGFLFSPHNFNLANGRIYLAHNHAGVWVVDVGTEERLQQPVAVGYYQPHTFLREDGELCQGRTWSAFYVDGYIYASDSCSGLNILQFHGDRGLEGRGVARVMPAQ